VGLKTNLSGYSCALKRGRARRSLSHLNGDANWVGRPSKNWKITTSAPRSSGWHTTPLPAGRTQPTGFDFGRRSVNAFSHPTDKALAELLHIQTVDTNGDQVLDSVIHFDASNIVTVLGAI